MNRSYWYNMIVGVLKSLNVPFADPCDPNYKGVGCEGANATNNSSVTTVTTGTPFKHITGTHTSGNGTVTNLTESVTQLTGEYIAADKVIRLTYLDENNSPNLISLPLGALQNDISTFAFNETTGALTITESDGSTFTVNLSTLGDVSLISNLIGGNRIATHSAGGVTSNINETITSIADIGTGNVIAQYTSEAGGSPTDITETVTGVVKSITGGQLIATYTNENGVAQTINESLTSITNTSTTGKIIANYLNEAGTSSAIRETITTLVDNGNNTATYTSENGTQVTFETTHVFTVNAGETAVSSDATLGTSTGGNDDTLHFYSSDSSVDIAVTNGSYVVDLKMPPSGDANNDIVVGSDGKHFFRETVTDITWLGATRELKYKDENGTTNTVVISEAADVLTTLGLANSVLSYKDELGNTSTIDLCPVVKLCETDTTLSYSASTKTLTYTNEAGTAVNIVLSQDTDILTVLSLTGNTLSYKDELGNTNQLVLPLTSFSRAGTSSNLNFTDENGTVTSVDMCPIVKLCETTTSLAYNAANGDLTYVDEDGTQTNINLPVENFLSAASFDDTTNILTLTLVDNTTFNVNMSDLVDDETVTNISYNATTNQVTYVNEDGVTQILNLNSPTVTGQAGREIARHIYGGVTSVINETVTNLSAVGRTITYRNENGSDQVVIIPDETLTVLTQAGRNITYRDEDGVDRVVTLPLTALTVNGNSLFYRDEDGNINTVPLPTFQETQTSLTLNNNTLTYTGENGVPVILDLPESSLGITGNTLIYTNELGAVTNVPIPQPPAETVTTLVQNGNSFTYNNENGTPVIVNLPVAALAIQGNGLSFTNENGANFILELCPIVKACETLTTLTYSATNQDLTYVDEAGAQTNIDLSALLDQPDILTSLTYDDGNGIITYIDEEGNPTALDITDVAKFNPSIVVPIVNGNQIASHTNSAGTLTAIHETVTTLQYNAVSHELSYRAENGTTTVVALDNPTLTYAGASNTLTHTAPDGTITNIVLDNLADASLITNLIAGNRIATHTNSDGVISAINETVTAIAYNAGTHVITYTDESGTAIPLNLDNPTIAYAPLTKTITFTAPDGTVTTLDLTSLEDSSEIQNTVAGNRIATHIGANGVSTEIDETITGITYNATTHTISYTDEAGAVNVLDLDNPSVTYSAITKQITHTAPDGTTSILDLSALDGTSVLSNLVAGNRIATHTSADGTVSDIDETITAIAYNGATGDLTYTDETGTPNVINLPTENFLGNASYNNTTKILTLTLTNGTTFDIDMSDLVDTGSVVSNVIAGNRIATHFDGDTTTLDIDETITTIAYNATSHTITYTAEGGAQTILDLDNPAITYNPVSQIITHTAPDGTVSNLDLSGLGSDPSVISNLVAGNRIATHTSSDGTVSEIDETITTATYDAANHTITYTNEAGLASVLDLDNPSIAFNAGTSIITHTAPDGTITNLDLSSISSDPSLVTNLVTGNRIATHTNGDGLVSTINETVTGITYDGTAHTITYTDETGVANVLDLDNPTLVYIAASNSLVHTAPDGTISTISLAPLNGSSGVGNTIAGNRIATHTGADGIATDIDETVTSIVYNANNHTITYVDETGTNTVLDLDNPTAAFAPATGILTFTAPDGTLTDLDLSPLGDTSTFTNAIVGNRIGTHTANGIATDVNETVTTMVTVGTTTTYTSEDGTTTDIVAAPSVVTNVIAAGNRIATHTAGDGTVVDVNETVTTLAFVPATGTLTYTDEAGAVTNLALGLAAPSVVTDVIAGNRIATHTSSDGTAVEIDETITSAAYVAATNTFTYTDEAGAATAIAFANSAVTNVVVGNPIATHTAANGAAVVINETVTTLAYAAATNALTYTDEAGTAVAVPLGESVVTDVIAVGNLIATHTSADGTVVAVNETITTILDNVDGTFTYTDEAAVPTILDVCKMLCDSGCIDPPLPTFRTVTAGQLGVVDSVGFITPCINPVFTVAFNPDVFTNVVVDAAGNVTYDMIAGIDGGEYEIGLKRSCDCA